MKVASFLCPHCRMPLRLQDPLLIGRTIECPECGRSLAIEQPPGDEIRGVAVEDDRDVVRSADAGRWRLTPTQIGWLIAGTTTVLLMGFLLFPDLESPTSLAANDVETDNAASIERRDEDNNTPAESVARRPDNSIVEQRDVPLLPTDTDAVTERDPLPAERTAGPPLPSKDIVAPQANDANRPHVEPPKPTEMPKLADNTRPASSPDDAAQVIADVLGVPAEPMEAPVPVAITYDTDRALKQRIAKFEQSAPIPLADMLSLIADMTAVPIHFDRLSEVGASRLQTPVTLSVENVPLAAILRDVLRQQEFDYQISPRGIDVIEPPTDAEPASNSAPSDLEPSNPAQKVE